MSLASDLTQTGELPEGALVDGVRHRSFTLRLPTVRDNIDAVNAVGVGNTVALNAALITAQLTQLGTLKPEQITFDLVCSLHPSDFNVLDGAAGELAKKRLAAMAVQASAANPQTGEPLPGPQTAGIGLASALPSAERA